MQAQRTGHTREPQVAAAPASGRGARKRALSPRLLPRSSRVSPRGIKAQQQPKLPDLQLVTASLLKKKPVHSLQLCSGLPAKLGAVHAGKHNLNEAGNPSSRVVGTCDDVTDVTKICQEQADPFTASCAMHRPRCGASHLKRTGARAGEPLGLEAAPELQAWRQGEESTRPEASSESELAQAGRVGPRQARRSRGIESPGAPL